MRRLAALLLFASLLSTVAVGQFIIPGVSVSPPPSCSTPALEFCLSANSMYINIGGL